MPPDPTNIEDMVHAALFSGDPAKALTHAALLDPWLAAHMADLMQALSLIEKEANDECVESFYWEKTVLIPFAARISISEIITCSIMLSTFIPISHFGELLWRTCSRVGRLASEVPMKF